MAHDRSNVSIQFQLGMNASKLNASLLTLLSLFSHACPKNSSKVKLRHKQAIEKTDESQIQSEGKKRLYTVVKLATR